MFEQTEETSVIAESWGAVAGALPEPPRLASGINPSSTRKEKEKRSESLEDQQEVES